jgi:hypothetical protein
MRCGLSSHALLTRFHHLRQQPRDAPNRHGRAISMSATHDAASARGTRPRPLPAACNSILPKPSIELRVALGSCAIKYENASSSLLARSTPCSGRQGLTCSHKAKQRMVVPNWTVADRPGSSLLVSPVSSKGLDASKEFSIQVMEYAKPTHTRAPASAALPPAQWISGLPPLAGPDRSPGSRNRIRCGPCWMCSRYSTP